MQAQEIFLAPPSVGLGIINRVRHKVAGPFDSRARGERLMREHTTHQIDTSLQEMSDRIHDPQVVLLGAQHIVAVVTRSYGQSSEFDADSGTEMVTVADENDMHDLFPGNSLGVFALPIAGVKRPVNVARRR